MISRFTHVDRQHGPRIDRQQAGPGREVIAVRPEVMDRLGLLVDDPLFGQRTADEPVGGIAAGLDDPARRELFLDGHRVALPLDPGGEPAADVPAAGDRQQVVKAAEQLKVGQRLEDAQRECRAADPAAGDRQPGQVPVERLEPRLLLGIAGAGARGERPAPS